MMILTNKLKIAIDHRRPRQIPHNLTLTNIAKLAFLLSGIHSTLKYLNIIPPQTHLIVCLDLARIHKQLGQVLGRLVNDGSCLDNW